MLVSIAWGHGGGPFENQDVARRRLFHAERQRASLDPEDVMLVNAMRGSP
jgi:hypothetical protein